MRPSLKIQQAVSTMFNDKLSESVGFTNGEWISIRSRIYYAESLLAIDAIGFFDGSDIESQIHEEITQHEIS